MASLAQAEREFIEEAARHFARENLFIRAANALGRPVEALVQRMLPEAAAAKISQATESALRAALQASLKTLSSAPVGERTFAASVDAASVGKWGHTAVATGTGALGGFFGLAALPLELPVTTTVMLRQVAAIAREFGEDLGSLEARLQCLSVFALAGARGREDEGYYAARVGLAELFRAANGWATKKTLDEIAAAFSRDQAPILVRLVSRLAERFQLVVTEKAMLQAVPVISTASAALVNSVFSEHVGATALYHFGLRALERRHGERVVQKAFGQAKARQDVS